MPEAADDVTINFGGNTIQHDADSDSVHSLTTTNPFELAGDTLSVVTATQVNNSVTLNGGTLTLDASFDNDQLHAQWRIPLVVHCMFFGEGVVT